MRSMLLSTALVFTALISSGCATLTVDKNCGVDAVSSQGDSGCCKGTRIGGLLGRMRGEGACSSCQEGTGIGRVGIPVGMGRGRIGSGIGCGPEGCGLAGRGIGGSGILAGGFGRAGGACQSCGLMGGNCRCIGNHSPYTPAFQGPHGPETGHYRYPYYTTRAPRDFLMSNPPSIGR